MGLFKRKPGGTVFGNILRGVVRTATGGLLGNGMLMLPAGSAGAPTTVPNTLPDQVANLMSGQSAAQLSAQNQTNNNQLYLYGGLGLAVIAGIYLMNKK